jgi:hypothetical protein
MKEHKKHGVHPHDKMSAMPQFNEGHWEKKSSDVELGGTKYTSEFGQMEKYKESVDGLSSYLKKHKPQH